MSKNKIINLVAIFVAVAIVATTSVVLVKQYSDNGSDVTKESVTAFQIIGNSDSENSDNQTHIDADKDAEQGTDNVTDKHGNTVTNKVDSSVDKPSNTVTMRPSYETTSKITASTPVNQDTASQQAGAFGFTWDAAAGVFYSTSDPWQRQFGYNQYYDKMGGYVMLFYDTVRVKFNYGGYDWLVQFWKGQYGFLLLGAEAGVYYKEEGNSTSHYVCTDNTKRLKIGYTCYNKGEVLFDRPYQDTWWLTGFVPGRLDKFADRSQMKMKIRITLKDAAMRDAFVEALTSPGVGFTEGNAVSPDTFYTSGNDVYLMWQTDRSKTS